MAGRDGNAGAESREAILALHRAGELARARAGYERLLAAAPGDAVLLGLLGMVALQEGRAEVAEALLRRAIDAPAADPRIHLRNLNNLLALCRAQERAEAAAVLAEAELPGWPPDAAPDPEERARVMSLAEALGWAGAPARGAALLESLPVHPGAGSAAFLLAGRLWLEAGDPAAALPHLRAACTADPGDWQALAALAAAHGRLGEPEMAREAATGCALAAPAYLAPAEPGQQATILVLNPAPTGIANPHPSLDSLHLATNFIAQASRMLADEFRFASVFADLPEPPAALPAADLVFNNIASGELLGQAGRLEKTTALAGRAGCPVLNPPEAVFRMTRQKAAARLDRIPGLRVPQIARYRRDLSSFEAIAADVVARFSYPVIVRHVAADSSSKSQQTAHSTATLAQDAGALRRFLEGVDWPQFYVIQYVDLRKPDGNSRKLRAAFIGDEIIMSRYQYGPGWLVGGQDGLEFYRRFPERVADIRRGLDDPETEFGPGLMPVLQEVRARVPLDLFGMDFDIGEDGRLVLFEAQATMTLLPTPEAPDRAIAPRGPGRRILRAFSRLVRSRLDASAGA